MLISVIAVAAVLGTIMVTVYANGEDTATNDETEGGCLPLRRGGIGWLSNLTDEQRAELQTMREEFQDAVKAKLEEWGVEVPAFQGQMGFGGLGPMRGGCGDFGLRGFQNAMSKST